jgi:hypothetical protein
VKDWAKLFGHSRRVLITPVPALSILREPSKYNFRCSGELLEIGVFISVHSTMKSTSACDLIIVRLRNSSEYGLSSDAHLMMRQLASLLVSIKIMPLFARGNQNSIEQLLDLGVTGLRLVKYLAD